MPGSDDLIDDFQRPDYLESTVVKHETVLDFGKYKGQKAGTVPAKWILWAYENDLIAISQELIDAKVEEAFIEYRSEHLWNEPPWPDDD